MSDPGIAPLRVAIVGSGGMAVARAERIAARSDMDLVVVAGRNPETGAALAARFGVEHTQDWESTVARADVDAVIVTTHPDTHAPMGATALAAGKHLFSESPHWRSSPLDASPDFYASPTRAAWSFASATPARSVRDHAWFASRSPPWAARSTTTW